LWRQVKWRQVKKTGRKWQARACFSMAMIFATGCGGGSGTTPGPPPPGGGTPAGAYVLTVTGASGGQTHNTSISLTVR
jgi:hypothetical protein